MFDKYFINELMNKWKMKKNYEILHIVYISDFPYKNLCHTCVIVSYLAFDQVLTQKPKEIFQTLQKAPYTKTKHETNTMYYL